MPLKKDEENPGTLTYWFHARGKGSVPISERTQHSYCLPGLCSPLIWKFNYIITRSRRAFLTVDARLAPAASLWRHHSLLIALKQPFSHWRGFFWVGEQDYPHVSRLKGRKLICNATLLSVAQVISAPPPKSRFAHAHTCSHSSALSSPSPIRSCARTKRVYFLISTVSIYICSKQGGGFGQLPSFFSRDRRF